MLPAVLASLLLAVPAQVEIRSQHDVVRVDDMEWSWIRPGTPLKTRVTRERGQRLIVDVMRVGPAEATKKRGLAVVRVGKRARRARLKVKLEEGRLAPGSSDLRLSYPVRYRYRLPASSMPVEVIASSKRSPWGLLVRVSLGNARARPEPGSLALAPLPGAAEKAKPKKRRRKATRRRRRRRSRTAEKKPPAEVKKDTDAKASTPAARTEAEGRPPSSTAKAAEEPTPEEPDEVEPPPTTTEPESGQPDAGAGASSEPASDEEDSAAAAKSSPAEAEATGTTQGRAAEEQPAPVEPDDEASSSSPSEAESPSAPPGPPPPTEETEIIELEPETPLAVEAPRYGLGTGVPLTIHTQVSPGLIATPVGGLQPIALSGGMRVLFGLNMDLLRFFHAGFGADLDYQAVSSDPGAALARVRWQTTQLRLRVEGEADLFRYDVLDLGQAHVGVLGGVGAVVGTHWLSVSRRAAPELLLGPTVRAGLTGGFTLGPGAVTVSVPVDWSVDVVGPVANYAPLAASLYLGYRLAL